MNLQNAFRFHLEPDELKSGGHLTITHHILASFISVIFVTIMPRSEKKLGNFRQDFSSLLPYFVTFSFSFIWPAFKKEFFFVMHQSIPSVTTPPPGQSSGKVSKVCQILTSNANFLVKSQGAGLPWDPLL